MRISRKVNYVWSLETSLQLPSALVPVLDSSSLIFLITCFQWIKTRLVEASTFTSQEIQRTWRFRTTRLWAVSDQRAISMELSNSSQICFWMEKVGTKDLLSHHWACVTRGNGPFYSFELSYLAFEWKWGWGWPCFDRNLSAFLM